MNNARCDQEHGKLPTRKHTWRAARTASLSAAAVIALLTGGCGGGSSNQAPDSQLLPDLSQLDGAPCADCRPNVLSGVAASGGALADAEVRVIDSQGRQAFGRTNAQGRYDIPVAELRGALLVQVTGLAGGLPTRLHSACRGAEIGTRAVNVTPLTELIVAQALSGRPAELLRAGRVDFFRLDAVTLRQAELAVEAVVRPVLNAAGVPTQVDLRVTPFKADHTGLDRALDWLVLEPAADAYRLRHVATGHADSALLRPGALSGVLPLPELPATLALGGIAAIAEVEARLADWTRLFAQGLPNEAAARALLADGFLDAGLDADAFISRVLRRDDSADQGGFSLRGARWHDARLLELPDANTARMRVQVSLPQPHPPRFEEMWWVKTGQGWLLRGDGAAARVRVRNAAVLGPKPMDDSVVRQLSGTACPAELTLSTITTMDQRCRIDGGLNGLPTTGVLDLGLPGDGVFGVLGLYRSLQELAEDRLTEHLLHSRLLALPSQLVERHLAFEIDARRVDARAVRALVFGPGLPATGLPLVPPARTAGAPVTEHWVVPSDADEDSSGDGDDWNGVRVGWCDAAVDATEALECASAWRSLSSGARYLFVFQDSAGLTLGQLETLLADAPPVASSLLAQAPTWFARFDVSQRPELQPRLARLLAPASTSGTGDPLLLHLPWQAPSDPRQRVVDARVTWWRAGYPPTSGEEVVRRRQLDGSGVVSALVPARAGFRTRWLVAQLWTQDPMGNLYLHFVAPNNPY